MLVSVRNIRVIAMLACGLSTTAVAHAQACCSPVNRPRPPVQTGCCTSPGVQVNVPTARISGASVNAPGVSIAAPAIAVSASSASASAAASGSMSAGSGAAGASFGGVQGWSASGGSAGEYYGGAGGYGYAAAYEAGGVEDSGLGAVELAGEGAAVEGESAVAATQTASAQAGSAQAAAGQAAAQAAMTSGKMMASGVRPVMASCLSAETKRNGAIGLYSQTQVDPDYDGELYRCSTGQRMVAWMGAMKAGRADFASADAFSCRVGDAIWHAPGGRLSCKTAAATFVEAKAEQTGELLGTQTLSGVRLVNVSPAAAAAMSVPAQVAVQAAKPAAVKSGRTEIQGNLSLGDGVGGQTW